MNKVAKKVSQRLGALGKKTPHLRSSAANTIYQAFIYQSWMICLVTFLVTLQERPSFPLLPSLVKVLTGEFFRKTYVHLENCFSTDYLPGSLFSFQLSFEIIVFLYCRKITADKFHFLFFFFSKLNLVFRIRRRKCREGIHRWLRL